VHNNRPISDHAWMSPNALAAGIESLHIKVQDSDLTVHVRR
jgi:hypothetical protein